MVGRSPDSRIYQIQHNPHYFHTGRVRNGDQVLIGVRLPELAMLRFSPVGDLIGLATRAVPEDLLHFSGSSVRADPDQLAAQIEDWKSELGFMPGVISIRPFFLAAASIGIKDLTGTFEAFISDPTEFDDELRQAIGNDLRDWTDAGNFVFWWNQDYDLNKDGAVITS